MVSNYLNIYSNNSGLHLDFCFPSIVALISTIVGDSDLNTGVPINSGKALYICNVVKSTIGSEQLIKKIVNILNNIENYCATPSVISKL